MAIDDELIHWEEGLYVQPQHFQLLQRQALRRLGEERRLALPYDYGVVSAQFDEEALGKQVVQFRELCAVMKSGLYVRYLSATDGTARRGCNARLEEARLPSKVGSGRSIRVLLGTRRYLGEDGVSASFVSDEAGGGFHIRSHKEVPDENTGGDSVNLDTRLIHARLFALGEREPDPDPTVWETLEVARLKAGDPTILDAQFAPPCLLLRAWTPLLEVVQDIVELVGKKRNDIVETSGAIPNNPSLADLQKCVAFSALTFHGATLSHALIDQALTAFEAYGRCLELLAALRGTDLTSAPVKSEYVHEDPWPAFERVRGEIEKELAIGPERVRFFDFEVSKDRKEVLECPAPLALIRKGYEPILAVASKDPDLVEKLVQQKAICVGSPSNVDFTGWQRRRPEFIEWKREESVLFEPIHPSGGATRFLALQMPPAAPSPLTPAWNAVEREGRLGVWYANVMENRRVELTFRLYFKPPQPGFDLLKVQ